MEKPGAEHPHPDLLLSFAERMAKQIGRNYVARTAEFIKTNYPGSADSLIPKLREIYKKHPAK